MPAENFAAFFIKFYTWDSVLFALLWLMHYEFQLMLHFPLDCPLTCFSYKTKCVFFWMESFWNAKINQNLLTVYLSVNLSMCPELCLMLNAELPLVHYFQLRRAPSPFSQLQPGHTSGENKKNIHYAFANCADGLQIPKQSELHKRFLSNTMTWQKAAMKRESQSKCSCAHARARGRWHMNIKSELQQHETKPCGWFHWSFHELSMQGEHEI